MPARNRTDFNSNNNNITKIIKASTISIGCGLLICVTLLMIFSFILKTKDFPHSYITPLTIVAIGVANFFAGIINAKLIRRKGLIFGGLCGVVFSLIILLSGLTFSADVIGYISIIKISVAVICGAIGGLIGINKIK
ncbi:MAG: TIGR04086 family membrane protein [Clostridia bacterium]